ncbi:MAG: PDZ domain-containing protein [Planctomycetota bacterium]
MTTPLRRSIVTTALLLAAPLSLAATQDTDVPECTCDPCTCEGAQEGADEIAPEPTAAPEPPTAPTPPRATNPDDRGYLGVRIEGGEGKGASVAGVVDSSAASRAGFKAGDLIVAVDGTKVRSTEDLLSALSGSRPGDAIRVKIRRGEDKKTLSVELGARPSSDAVQELAREPRPRREAKRDAPEPRPTERARGQGRRKVLSPTTGGGSASTDSLRKRIQRLEAELEALQAELEAVRAELERRSR